MINEGDADLLAYMDLKEDCPGDAREAWAEFYRRHIDFLHYACERVLGGFSHRPIAAEDLVTETFMRAYEKAGTYKEPAGLDAEGKRRYVRAWLSKVARNIFQNHLRAVPECGPELLLGDERLSEQAAPESCGSVNDGRTLAALQEALQQDLDEREQEVMRVTAQYYRPGRVAQRLPNSVTEELARQLGTTGENLRKIRQRAMAKLNAGLERRLGPLPLTA